MGNGQLASVDIDTRDVSEIEVFVSNINSETLKAFNWSRVQNDVAKANRTRNTKLLDILYIIFFYIHTFAYVTYYYTCVGEKKTRNE